MQKISISDEISQTLLITLYMRAKEQEYEKPILEDKYSFWLKKKIDYDFSRFKNAPLSQIGTNLRAKYFDEECENFIKKHKNAVVVFIGSGLDTRYLRLKNKDAIFYELDLPEVINLREKLIKNDDCYHLKTSAFETKWMDELSKKHKNANFLFLAEGVLMYFEEEIVKSFLINLTKRFNAEIIFDALSVWLSKNSKKHDVMRHEKASFKFGIDDDKSIEKWHQNINYISTKYIMKLKINKINFLVILFKLISLIPKFKKSSKILRFKLN